MKNFGKALLTILTSIITGLLIAFVLFLIRERIFPVPDIAGQWCMEMHTTQTAKVGYQDMVVRYVAILWREGLIVKGTMEKVYDFAPNTGDPPKTYSGDNRTRSTLEGFIQKLYTGSKDQVTIHIIEEGEKRVSTHFHDLAVAHSHDLLSGTFVSTAADSEGIATWRRILRASLHGGGF